MTDPISDSLTRLRNASKARLDDCVMPHSRLKEAIVGILKAEGYVADFSSSVDAQGHKTLVVKMKYVDRKSTRLNSSHVSESRMPSSA